MPNTCAAPRAPILKLKYHGKCLEMGLLSMGFYLNLPGSCLRVKLSSRCLAIWSRSLFNDGRRVRVRPALVGNGFAPISRLCSGHTPKTQPIPVWVAPYGWRTRDAGRRNTRRTTAGCSRNRFPIAMVFWRQPASASTSSGIRKPPARFASANETFACCQRHTSPRTTQQATAPLHRSASHTEWPEWKSP